MTCLSDGLLRAKVDGELSGEELLEFDRHLSSCAECRKRMHAVSAQALRVREAFAT
ncbi:MAG: anti-sigma factor family protein, partial [Terriglobia bacterium]